MVLIRIPNNESLITLSITLLLLSSCTHPIAKISSISYNGIWQSIGHGEFLEIKEDEAYAFYDITTISCVPRRIGSLDEISKALTLKADTLALQIGVVTTRYTRAYSLPKLCIQPLDEDKANDPHYNFEVFMEMVKNTMPS